MTTLEQELELSIAHVHLNSVRNHQLRARAGLLSILGIVGRVAQTAALSELFEIVEQVKQMDVELKAADEAASEVQERMLCATEKEAPVLAKVLQFCAGGRVVGKGER